MNLKDWSWLWGEQPPETNLALSSVRESYKESRLCQNEELASCPPLDKSIADKLLSYQVDPVRWHLRCLKKYNVTIDGSFCGIGKTYIFCAVAKALRLKPLILCPKATITQTKRVLEDHFGMEYYDLVTWELIKLGKTKWLKRSDDGRTSSGSSYQWTIPPDTFLIFDEFQRAKSITSLAMQMTVQAKKQNIPILAASATLANNPTEMKALGYMTGLHNLTDFEFWMFQNGVKLTEYGYFFPSNEKIIQSIGRKIFPDRGVRVRPSDVKGLFPETQILATPFDPLKKKDAEEINSLFDQMKKEINSTVAKYSAKSQENLSVLMKYHRKIETLKVPLIVELAEEYESEGQSVAIFCQFRDTVGAVAKALKCPYILGGMNDRQRQQAIDNFQSDRSHYIVATTDAGGTGLSLHSIGDKRMRRALISPSFNAVNFQQVLGRVHRAGGNPSIQNVVFIAGTPEEVCAKKVSQKLRLGAMLTDGDLSDLSFQY